MKRLHLLALVIIAVSAGVIFAMSGDYTTYANFAECKANPDKTIHVVGHLLKNESMVYDPQKDANYFEFSMTDKDGNRQRVFYRGVKPQDFERSEQLVVKGNMEGKLFHASEILMKCPSKYVDDEITLKEKSV